MSHFEQRELVEQSIRDQGDLTVTELVRLAIALGVPAADLLAVAMEITGVDDQGAQS